MAPWILAVSALLLAAPPEARFDRARVVGAPVLDGATPPAEGLYVWLEDGAFHLSFVAPATGRKGRGKYQAELSASQALTAEKRGGIELERGGTGTLYASGIIEPTERRIEAAVKGSDLTISLARGPKGPIPIFVGPTAEPAAKTVTIGSFSPYAPKPSR